MPSDSLIVALKRCQERPDIHKVDAVRDGTRSHPVALKARALDLKEHAPAISNRELSTLLGVAHRTIALWLLGAPVSTERHQFDSSEQFSEDQNKLDCAAALTFLRDHFPGQEYGEHPNAKHESDVPVVVHSHDALRQHGPATYKTDQSHTVRKPVTLPTRPFSLVA